MNREKNLKELSRQNFDVCVIGAGASGAGVALDATLRGYKVLLIDSGDFCGETSSKSTKLIHGGVRYLEQAFKKFDFGQLKQVRHGLKERKYLYSNARYITKKLGIITPVFSFIEGLYYFIGLKVYGLFALKDHFPSARWLNKKELLTESPNITPKVHSGVLYYDGQLDDARFVVSLVKTARKNGAAVLNYCKLQCFEKNQEGKLQAATVLDLINAKEYWVKARVFVNCTGPFSDKIRLLANPGEHPRIVPSKGVHLILPIRFFVGDKALLIPKTTDGRLIFVIPFRNKVMIGTTDTPYDSEKEPFLERNEAKYLLETAKPYLDIQPALEDITAGFGGVRPLLMPSRRNAANTKSLLRDHEVEVDEESGLVSLLGGKWTTYRLMAEDTVNAVDRLFKQVNKCQTTDYKLDGNDAEATRPIGIDDDLWNHLLSYYGNHAAKIIEIAEGNLEKIHPEHSYLKAELRYVCRFEMVEKIRDFTARRTRWEILNRQTCFDSIIQIAEIMAEELHWPQERKLREIEKYKAKLSEVKHALLR